MNMKLSEYAKELGVTYKTAWNYYKQGRLNAYQTHTGTIIVKDVEKDKDNHVAIYCRVSSSENKSNLESQKKRLLDYCAAKGYAVASVITEIGSGVDDSRKKWLTLLQDKSITLIVVEHKDRFTRFGYNGYKTLLENEGRNIEVINGADNGKEDLIQDLVSIITSFCARLYGQRRCKRKTEKIIQELTQ
ncbi:MAG: IS607 family transposase [Magnetococcales bacterium]|nr:IS607 family transposase [Nitrospirota bacterium]